MREHRSDLQDPILEVWQAELREASKRPWLAALLLQRGREIYGRFVHYYQTLQSLSRRSRRRLVQRFAVGLGGLALVMAINGGPVLAANITVGTNDPIINDDNICSLNEAIFNANDNTTGLVYDDCTPGTPNGADTIILSGNSYVITYANDATFYGNTGLRRITSEVTIQGNGATIERIPAPPRVVPSGIINDPYFRIIGVGSGASLTLDDVTISGGNVNGFGGGVYSYEGNITLVNNTVISGNVASGAGGGISQYGYNASVDLTITDSTVSGNLAAAGGGVESYSYSGTATITVNNSIISGNSARYPGGGILNGGYLASNVTIENNSQVSNNASYYSVGGGIANFSYYDANVTIQSSSVISGNQSALLPAAPLENPAGTPPPLIGSGGGIFNSNYGISSSLLGEGVETFSRSGNRQGMRRAGRSLPQDVSGVTPPAYEAIVTINNSIITGNSVNGSGGGVSNRSSNFGAIYVENNASVTNNTAVIGTIPTGVAPITVNGGGLNNVSVVCGTCAPVAVRTLNNHQSLNGIPFGTLAGVLVDNSTVSGNTAVGNGGGIYNYAEGRAYVDLINEASVNNNTAYGYAVPRETVSSAKRDRFNSLTTIAADGPLDPLGFGGGIFNRSQYAAAPPVGAAATGGTQNRVAGDSPAGYAQLLVDNSTISGNTSQNQGGGAANYSYGVAYSNVQNNAVIMDNQSSSAFGGGISNYARLDDALNRVMESTVSGNQSASFGGGVDNTSYLGDALSTIDKSTLSGNVSSNGGALYNGSIIYLTANTDVNNSTISGNSAAYGGGLYNYNGDMTLTHATISNNSASSAGGGLYNDGGTVNLYNSLIAGNPTGGDCAATINSGGFNLDSDGSCVTDGVNNDITVADPLLGPLQLNAPGSTETHALLAGSPAIDAIPFAADACGLLPDDQRGVLRPQGADACDIGAFERQLFTNFLPLVLNNASFNPDLVITNLDVSGGQINVTIQNQGNRTVTEDFWVDLYLNPSAAPTAVNEVWEFLSTYGAAWGVTADLAPGQELALTLNDSYFDPDNESNLPAVIASGTTIYAQVDAAHVNTTFGGVLEDHEINGDPYNNVSGPEVTISPITSALLNFVSGVVSRLKMW